MKPFFAYFFNAKSLTICLFLRQPSQGRASKAPPWPSVLLCQLYQLAQQSLGPSCYASMLEI